MPCHTSEHHTAIPESEVVPDSTGTHTDTIGTEITQLKVLKLDSSAAIWKKQSQNYCNCCRWEWLDKSYGNHLFSTWFSLNWQEHLASKCHRKETLRQGNGTTQWNHPLSAFSSPPPPWSPFSLFLFPCQGAFSDPIWVMQTFPALHLLSHFSKDYLTSLRWGFVHLLASCRPPQ